MKQLNTYPAYKDSGVEWIGMIPASWEAVQLKRYYSVTLGKMLQPRPSSPEDTLEKYLRAANIQWLAADVSDIAEMWFSPMEKKKYLLSKGDLLVSEGGDVGRSCIWNGEIEPVYIQNAINRLRAKKDYSTRFLFYWMYAIKIGGYVDALCNKSTIPHYTAEKVAATIAVFPPQPEQQTIARFLDHKTALIDQYIANKKKQIELLEKLRTAIISEAVTKGLNPDVEMKDSGVEWLVGMPDGWSNKKLKFLSQKGLTNGIFKKKDKYGRGTKLINVADAYAENYFVDFHALDRVETTKEDREIYGVREGDIFFVRSSLKREGIAASACVESLPEGAVFECHLVGVRPRKKEILPPFLIYYLNSSTVRDRLVALSYTTTMTTISQPNIADLEVFIPPLDEQQEIVAFIKNKLEKVSSGIKQIRNQITKIESYRTSLISEAVTGKIDVRGFKPEPMEALTAEAG